MKKSIWILVAVISSSAVLVPTANGESVRNLQTSDEVVGLVAGPSGGVYFAAESYAGTPAKLFFRNTRSRARLIRLSKRQGQSQVVSILGLGGNGQIWVVTKERVPSTVRRLHLISGVKEVGSRRLPQGFRPTSIAAGPAGTTWMTGYEGRTITYFDRKLRPHSVALPHASAYEGLVRGGGGTMWATSRNTVARMTLHGTVRRFKTRSQVNFSIVALRNEIWVTGSGELQRISDSGEVTRVPLARPTWEARNGGNHVSYDQTRSPFGLFVDRSNNLRFIAGAVGRSSGSGDWLDDVSVGGLTPSGAVVEAPTRANCWADDWEQRHFLPVAVDTGGHIWTIDCADL